MEVMSKTLQAAAVEIERELSPLPEGFYVKPENDSGILIGNHELGFAITRVSIEDKRHLVQARASFASLLKALSQYHATLAADYDKETLLRTADSVKSLGHDEIKRARKTMCDAVNMTSFPPTKEPTHHGVSN